MHKNWKKRFKKFWFDIDNHLEIVGCSILGGLLFGVGSLFVLDQSFFGNVFASATMAIVGFMYASTIGQILISEESKYEEVQQEKANEENTNKNKKEETKEEIKDYYYALLSDNNKRYQTGDKEVWLSVSDLLQTIYHITNSYPLTEEENHYVSQKITKDIYELVHIYEKLTYQNKKEYKMKLISTAKEKETELQHHFVERFQNQLKQQFEQKHQEVQTKQYERVYIQD